MYVWWKWRSGSQKFEKKIKNKRGGTRKERRELSKLSVTMKKNGAFLY